jgi:transcriptional regulator with XRE-family HTH domain
MSRPEKNHPLFHWRKANGNVSLQSLADKVGCTQSFLSQVETGIKRPSLKTAMKLHAQTGIPLEQFAKEESAQ